MATWDEKQCGRIYYFSPGIARKWEATGYGMNRNCHWGPRNLEVSVAVAR
jgi:hypothetical protein